MDRSQDGSRYVGNSYVLLDTIGHGGTGAVWRAVDRTSGETVAIKLLRADLVRNPKLVTRFVQERAILLSLRHEHIVRVRDLLTVGPSLGFVMDLVEGGSLRDHLRERGTLPVGEAARLLSQAAAALAEAHRRRVVHRDLKPDNILIERRDGETSVRLTDFGLARVLDAPGITTPGTLLGTPNYLAPETIDGARPGTAADVYALGVLMYELITGRAPYADRTPAAALRQHLEGTPHRPAGVPDAAWTLIEACMAKDPAERPTAATLVSTLDDLARTTAGLPALAPAKPGHHPTGPERSPDDPTGPERSPDHAAGTGQRPDGGPAEHPSIAPQPRSRTRHNRVTSQRWFRPGAVLLLVVAGALAYVLPALNLSRLRYATPAQPTAQATTGSGPHTGPPAVRSPAPPHGARAATGGGQPATGRTGAGGPARTESAEQPFGPWRCGDGYQFNGHPLVVKLCYATGGAIRIVGHTQAYPGIRADISLMLQDAGTGARVAGPYTCAGVLFTDREPQHDCGPFQLDPPRGHRYVVVQSWRYTTETSLPGGTARGPEFTW